MPSPEVTRVKRTINKIDALRERVHHSRRNNSRCIEIENTFERDIILKALELMRETVNVGHIIDTVRR